MGGRCIHTSHSCWWKGWVANNKVQCKVKVVHNKLHFVRVRASHVASLLKKDCQRIYMLQYPISREGERELNWDLSGNSLPISGYLWPDVVWQTVNCVCKGGVVTTIIQLSGLVCRDFQWGKILCFKICNG